MSFSRWQTRQGIRSLYFSQGENVTSRKGGWSGMCKQKHCTSVSVCTRNHNYWSQRTICRSKEIIIIISVATCWLLSCKWSIFICVYFIEMWDSNLVMYTPIHSRAHTGIFQSHSATKQLLNCILPFTTNTRPWAMPITPTSALSWCIHTAVHYSVIVLCCILCWSLMVLLRYPAEQFTAAVLELHCTFCRWGTVFRPSLRHHTSDTTLSGACQENGVCLFFSFFFLSKIALIIW